MKSEKKAFIFSYDAVISLLLIVTFLTFITYYTNTYSYSTMKDYETIRNMDTALNTLIASGEIQQAVQQTIIGNSIQAKANLRQSLQEIVGKKCKAKLTIEVYNSAGARIYLIEAQYPEKAHTSKKKTIYSTSNIFSTGDYYGTVKLQEWN